MEPRHATKEELVRIALAVGEAIDVLKAEVVAFQTLALVPDLRELAEYRMAMTKKALRHLTAVDDRGSDEFNGMRYAGVDYLDGEEKKTYLSVVGPRDKIIETYGEDEFAAALTPGGGSMLSDGSLNRSLETLCEDVGALEERQGWRS